MLDEMMRNLERLEERNNNIESGIDLNYHDTQPAKEIISNLIETQSEVTKDIYEGLVETLWDRRWEPNPKATAVEGIDDEYFRTAILNSFTFKESNFREDAIPAAYRDTFSWVYTSQPQIVNGKPLWSSFPAWLEADTDQPYWITGKPGSGKSTLMKFMQKDPRLLTHLRKWTRGLPVCIANYYAWIAGSQLQKSHEGLIRTILYKCLLWNPDLIPEVATRRWALFTALRNSANQPDWEDWELHECLASVLKKISCGQTRKLVLFIDGLDEFDRQVLPRETIALIQQMAAWPGVKVCVASRQWSEFQDALDDNPMLRVQDLTGKDMELYVHAKFKENRGFAELVKIHPQETQVLLSDIAEKANGVFLWLSLVVKSLLEGLSEGDGLRELREAFDALPDELEALYSFIWASIKDRNHSVSAQILGLLRAAHEPIDYLTFWLAGSTVDYAQAPEPQSISHAARSGILETVIRRLDSKTRGILEVSTTGIINFLHRTAREWMEKPEIWANICSSLPQDFDPNLRLFYATTLRLGERTSKMDVWAHKTDLQRLACEGLVYAVRVESLPSNNPKFAQILEGFDTTMKVFYKNWYLSWYKHLSLSSKAENLHTLAAELCLLPYLANALEQKGSVSESLLSNMLEDTIVGLDSTAGEPWAGLAASTSRRRDTVALLLEYDGLSRQSRRNRRKLFKLSKSRLDVSRSKEDTSYWLGIIELLTARKSKFSGFRSWFSVGITLERVPTARQNNHLRDEYYV